jgi:hypothetical protein
VVIDEDKTGPKTLAPRRVDLSSGVGFVIVSADQVPLAVGLIRSLGRSEIMLTLSGSLRVFLPLEPCGMRKSFDSLHALILSQRGKDPRGGAVFFFTSRTRTLIKLLPWDGAGPWVHAKRRKGRHFLVEAVRREQRTESIALRTTFTLPCSYPPLDFLDQSGILRPWNSIPPSPAFPGASGSSSGSSRRKVPLIARHRLRPAWIDGRSPIGAPILCSMPWSMKLVRSGPTSEPISSGSGIHFAASALPGGRGMGRLQGSAPGVDDALRALQAA